MKTKRSYQICKKCVMDTTDSQIVFNPHGVCNHCSEFESETKKNWFPNKEGEQKLKKIFFELKKQRKDFNYDCILGLSGGLDSSYLALVLKKYDLRPLAVHIDAGWNSELAVFNIEKIVKFCGFDLYTYVVNWQEIRDLQLAYLKAGIANQDVVQDHAFFATIYDFAVKNKIQFVISGGNIATEGVFPLSWHHAAMDAKNLKAIHKKFGQVPLKDYKTISFFEYYLYFPFIKRMKVFRPLNYLPYNPAQALRELQDKVGFKAYGHKHNESRFTKFFQNYYLPHKFGIDKRRPHLSSMILSGLVNRQQAIEDLKQPLYNENDLQNDKNYIAKKLGITYDQLNEYIALPGNHYSKYPNWDFSYAVAKRCQTIVSFVLGRTLKKYS